MQNNTTELTIAVFSYNRAHYLPQMLESIAKQTFGNFIVKIYDNASTDNTEEVVQPFLSDGRFHFMPSPKNIGPEANFNRAITECDTKYLLLTHDDDHMLPTFVEKSLATIKSADDILFVSTFASIIDKNGNHVPSECDAPATKEYKNIVYNQYELIEAYIRGENTTVCPTTMFKTSILRDNNILFLKKVGRACDTFFYFEVNTLQGRIITLTEPLYEYRVHGAQDSSKWPYIIPMLRNFVYQLLKHNKPLRAKWLQFVTPQTLSGVQCCLYPLKDYFFARKGVCLQHHLDLRIRLAFFYCAGLRPLYLALKHLWKKQK